MTWRRVTVGISLIGVLLVCSVAAAGASAAGTTAYTCVKVPAETGEFEDAHCEKSVGSGTYDHETIKEGVPTTIEAVNVGAFFLKGTVGEAISIECSSVTGTGEATNKTVAGTMVVEGTLPLTFTTCTVPKPVSKGGAEECEVGTPFTLSAKVKSWESGKEMGLEFFPKEAGSKEFGDIVLKDKGTEECPGLGGKPVEGTAIATPGAMPEGKGATYVFTKPMTEKTILFNEKAATLEGTLTIKVKSGNPIALTTK